MIFAISFCGNRAIQLDNVFVHNALDCESIMNKHRYVFHVPDIKILYD